MKDSIDVKTPVQDIIDWICYVRDQRELTSTEVVMFVIEALHYFAYYNNKNNNEEYR